MNPMSNAGFRVAVEIGKAVGKEFAQSTLQNVAADVVINGRDGKTANFFGSVGVKTGLLNAQPRRPSILSSNPFTPSASRPFRFQSQSLDSGFASFIANKPLESD